MDWEDRYRQWRELAPPRKLEEWAQSLASSPGENLNTQKFGKAFTEEFGKVPDSADISKWIIEQGMNKNTAIMAINDDWSQDVILDFGKGTNAKEKPQNLDLDTPHYQRLDIQKHLDGLTIKEGVIKQIVIPKGKHDLTIKNCCIGNITIHPGNHSINIKNSWIGSVDLHPSSIDNLLIQGGWICVIRGPATYEANPFRGSVDFENVKMPTSKIHSTLFKGAQQYRNLRAHFESLQNGSMAGLMRAKELTSDRETTDSWVTRLFSWVYSAVSGYGQKPERAFILFFLLLAMNVVILTLTNGVRMDEELQNGAWQKEYSSKFGMASILTVQKAMNPFRIFVAKSAYKFKSLGNLIHTWFFVILADGAFLFGVFAIRKRLKF